jgi:hypothetical protein
MESNIYEQNLDDVYDGLNNALGCNEPIKLAVEDDRPSVLNAVNDSNPNKSILKRRELNN